MTAPLDPETKRLRRLSPGALADEALALKKRIDAIKDEAIRRRLKTAEGEAGRITLSPPGSQDRTERELLLKVLVSPKQSLLPASPAPCRPIGG